MKKQKKNTMKETLLQKTKKALYEFAQSIGLSGRSTMSKKELVQSLEQREKEVKTLLKQTESASSSNEDSDTIEKAKKEKITAAKDANTKPVPKSISEPVEQHAASSHIEEPPALPAAEPAEIWHGETGPEMPRSYGRTMLYAMPRDPNWIYLYWEISDDTKHEIQDQKGEWVFESSSSVLRIYDAAGNVYQEVPVLLDAMCWYLSLPSSRDFLFEIGIKAGEEFIALAKSNKISLTQAEPSSVMDEEWAVVEERFAEMLQSAAQGRMGSAGASEKVMPHLLTQRFRIPWEVPNLHGLPSSHSMSSHSMSSTYMQKSKN